MGKQKDLPHARGKKSRNAHGRTSSLGKSIVHFCDKEQSITGVATGFLSNGCAAASPDRVRISTESFGLLLKVRSGNTAQELRVFIKDARLATEALIGFLEKQGVVIECRSTRAEVSASV